MVEELKKSYSYQTSLWMAKPNEERQRQALVTQSAAIAIHCVEWIGVVGFVAGNCEGEVVLLSTSNDP